MDSEHSPLYNVYIWSDMQFAKGCDTYELQWEKS